jgi:hypothetical protein
MAKEAQVAEQQTAAKFAAKKGKKVPTRNQVVLDLDKLKFSGKKVPMTASEIKEAKMAKKNSKKEVKSDKKSAPTTGRKRIDPDAKISVVKKENPFREGTNRYKSLELVKKARTVGEALKNKSVAMMHVKRAARLGIIKIAA